MWPLRHRDLAPAAHRERARCRVAGGGAALQRRADPDGAHRPCDREGLLRAGRGPLGPGPGLVEEPRTAYATFNARAETVATKPVVRAVYRGSCGSLGKAALPIVGARRRLGVRTVRCGGRRLTLIRRRCRRKNRAEPSHRVGESRGDGTSLLVELLVTATLELSEML